ncbi:MAG: hypothetical protein IBX56_00185 [Methylomicrobium sp.]|nr:hypothetical protein [Methylomicrobium sp.]
MDMKAKPESEQIDLFFEEPEIGGLGIVEFKIINGEVKATIKAATNTPDIARIDDECWKRAVAEWLVVLCAGDRHEATNLLAIAKARLLSRMDEAA